jgi:hypothetical protein
MLHNMIVIFPCLYNAILRLLLAILRMDGISKDGAQLPPRVRE